MSRGDRSILPVGSYGWPETTKSNKTIMAMTNAVISKELILTWVYANLESDDEAAGVATAAPISNILH